MAESIASGLGSAGYTTDLCNLNGATPPGPDGYDLLGVGSPVYYFRPPFNVSDYLERLPTLNGLPTFTFVLHGSYRGDAGTAMRRALAAKGARECGYFHSQGADYFLGYLRRGFLFSPRSPKASDLAAAAEFGRKDAAHAGGERYEKPEEDVPPKWIYRLERFFANRWLGRHFLSRQFKVDRKRCDGCGLCIQLCPTVNIQADDRGQPRWGRECLLCLTCQMKCPADAVKSAIDNPLFAPLIAYNVGVASRDPALEPARVVHERGETRML